MNKAKDAGYLKNNGAVLDNQEYSKVIKIFL